MPLLLIFKGTNKTIARKSGHVIDEILETNKHDGAHDPPTVTSKHHKQ